VLERLVVLLPGDWQERRDRGLAQAAIGRIDRAADDLAAYLEHMPQAEDRGAIAERLRTLRSAGRPRLH
jgi:regulator of sirC expression with transglutaminase-like and TPR domain